MSELKLIINNIYQYIRNINLLYTTYLFIKRDTRLLNEKTDLVIEGFPRSGNSYLLAFIQVVSKKKLKISSHTHKISNIFNSIKKNLKLIILIRDPINTIVSNYIYYNKNKDINHLLRLYLSYYESLLKIQRNKKIIFFDFRKINNNKYIFNILNKLKISRQKKIKKLSLKVLKRYDQNSIFWANKVDTKSFHHKKKNKFNKKIIKKKIRSNKVLLEQCNILYKKIIFKNF